MNAITKCTLAGLVKYAKKSEVRFKVVRAYLAQHCFFLPLPHVPIGIQNAAGTNEKKQKRPQPAFKGKYRFTNSGLRYLLPNRG